MFEEYFHSLCKEAAEKTENFGTEFSMSSKLAVFIMYCRTVKLELILKRNSFGNVNNVLYCRVYPNKNREIFYLLPEVFVELDIDEFRSTFFSMIENEARLEACFLQLWSIITKHLPSIEHAVGQGLLPWEREVKDDDFSERKLLFGSVMPASREPFVILDYTKGNVYRALLNGDCAKAVRTIEKYRAKGKTLEYQNRLCDYLKANCVDYSPMPNECNAVRDDDLAERKALPARIGIFVAIFLSISALFLVMKLAFDLFFMRGSVAVYGAPWYCSFLLGAIPSLFGMIAFRKQIMKLIFPKRAKTMTERDEVKNGEGVNKLARVAFVLAMGFAMFVFIMIELSFVRVYNDRLDAASDENIFWREEYRFSDIKEICHISARYNVYGDRIERASYVLIMKDGRKLDLDVSLSNKQAEKELLPLLRDYSIPVIMLDSDREMDMRMEKTDGD